MTDEAGHVIAAALAWWHAQTLFDLAEAHEAQGIANARLALACCRYEALPGTERAAQEMME